MKKIKVVLHPFLRALKFNLGESFDEVRVRSGQPGGTGKLFYLRILRASRIENATEPPTKLVLCESFKRHECSGPALTHKSPLLHRTWHEDDCTIPHAGGSEWREVITVEDFVRVFVESLSATCENYASS